MAPSLALVTAVLALAAVQSCSGQVLQVVFVHRHGSRTRLAKNGTTLLESASVLTPVGMDQLYSVGQQARARFLNPATCGSTCLTGTWSTWSTNNWTSTSSAVDRTLQSADSFLLGLLTPNYTDLGTNFTGYLGYQGGIQPVPVYSMSTVTDWLIRAFGEQKCPTYLNDLKTFFTNNSYFAQENQTTAALRAYIAGLQGLSPVDLPDVWNYFDEYNVQYAYGANTPDGGPELPPINASIFQQVTAAANWMEWNRYGNTTQAGGLCGGGLLAEIIANIDAGAGGLTSVPPAVTIGQRLNHFSGHYATQLCLLAAINISQGNPATDVNNWIYKIPEYAALMAFSVTQDASGSLRIALDIQDGEANPYRRVILPCSPAFTDSSSTDGTCDYNTFKTLVAPKTYPTVSQWCTACANTTMLQCAAANYMKLVAANSSLAAPSPPPSAALATAPLATQWVVLPLLALLALYGLF